MAGGEIRVANGLVTTGFFSGWLSPFAIACGLFAQGLFAFLAATYMTVDTRHDPELQEDFRLRALLSGLSLAPAAALVFFVARSDAPYIFSGLTNWWSPLLLLWTSLCAVAALVLLWLRDFEWARLAAIGQVAFIIGGWALAQFPYLIVPDVTYMQTAAPEITLRLVVLGLGAGAVILIPSLFYLLHIFKFQGDALEITDS